MVMITRDYSQRVYPVSYTHLNILEQNPYRLADDIEGVGFRTADEIASRAGIKIDSEFRIKSGIFYVLNQATMQGHTYLPYDKLVRQINELLLIDVQDYDKYQMCIRDSR